MFHEKELPRTQRTVAIISGGSVEPELLVRVLVQADAAYK
jgi:hypothetical protein